MAAEAPMTTYDEVLACGFSNWYKTFRSVTFASRILPLPQNVLEYLLDDGSLFLPKSATNVKFHGLGGDSDEESDTEEWKTRKEDDAAPSKPLPSFPEFEAIVAKKIAELGGAVLPKLNWSAPRDATWIATCGSMKCTSPGDIFLLLKSSDFIAHDLTDPFEGCHIANVTPAIQYELVLRNWINVLPSQEFRCFVRNKNIVGISQRDYTNHYKTLETQREAILNRIELFFSTEIAPKFPLNNYIFDVYLDTNQVYLVDFNPFSGVTDPLLFSWLETPLVDAVPEKAAEKSVKETREESTEQEQVPQETVSVPEPEPSAVDHANKFMLTALLNQINKARLDPAVRRLFRDDDDSSNSGFSDTGSESDQDDDDAEDQARPEAEEAPGTSSATETSSANNVQADGASSSSGQPQASPKPPIDLRLSTDSGHIQPTPYLSSRIPLDVFTVKSTEDIDRLMQLYREGKLEGQSSDEDDD